MKRTNEENNLSRFIFLLLHHICSHFETVTSKDTEHIARGHKLLKQKIAELSSSKKRNLGL